ncbi:MAG: hypothetical protein ACYS0C_09250 [Planctomycetota bacterium]|jgi:hypothetical protein
MKNKWAVFAALAVFLVLVMNSGSEAIDTGQIDNVRNKEVLDNQDLRIIDKFVAEGVQELMDTRDFTSIAKVRAVISSRNSSNRDSASAQYAEQFSESARKYISEAFEAANELTLEEHKFKTILNLLILVDSLEDIRLASLATQMLNDENKAIRYWAVHSVTNPGFVEQLNATEAAKSEAQGVIQQLKVLVEGSGHEMVALIAEFAAGVDVPQGEDLLLQIADMRIKRYANWTVEYELLEGTILRLLDSKIPSAGLSNSAVARRFGQLYSYVMQRYVKGQDFLSSMQIQQLASVLVETEVFCISKRLEAPQSVIKKAIERDDYITLLEQHNRLLGDETRAGELPLKLNFDYGKKPDGNRRIAPLALPDPP